MLKYFFCLFAGLLISQSGQAQQKVAITIDDVPNNKLYLSEDEKSILLLRLDSLDIPVTIFINEKFVKNAESVRNKLLLEEWVKNENINLGNHSFSHAKYSKVGIQDFAEDIKKGALITKQLAQKYNKELEFFRAPYNDLGEDSIQHEQLDSALTAMGYVNTPFTIESSDWMFNKIYTTRLEEGDCKGAKEIAELYVSKTLEYFQFFDSLSIVDYGRKINHIYLCHDNQLNTDYLTQIISKLVSQGYEMTTLKDVLQDDFYAQEDKYYLKWGVSWYYRFMDSQEDRMNLMRSEPDLSRVYELFERLK